MGHKPANIRKSIRVDIGELGTNLEKYGKRAHFYVEKNLQETAEEMRMYMRQHRPWTDRTSNARLSLDAKVENPREGYYRIGLKHGVYYGYYLEHGVEGRNRPYPILGPTKAVFEEKILENMRGILDRWSLK